MSDSTNRRGFLGRLAGLLGLPAVAAAKAEPGPKVFADRWPSLDGKPGPCHPDWICTTCTVTYPYGEAATIAAHFRPS